MHPPRLPKGSASSRQELVAGRRTRKLETYAIVGAFFSQACSETTGFVLRQESEVDASVVRDSSSDKSEASPVADSADSADSADALDAGDVIVDACKTCSGTIVMTSPQQSMLWGGDGGRQNSDDCGVGEAVVGYLGTVNGTSLMNNDAAVAIIGSIQTICGHLLTDDSSTTVTWGPSIFPSLPFRGTPTTVPWSVYCNTDEVVIALRGGYGAAFDQIDVICGKLQRSPTIGDKTVMVDPTAGRLAGVAGGDGFGATYAFECGVNRIVIGSVVHSGAWVDSFGVNCATPNFVLFDGGARCCSLGTVQVSQLEDSSVSEPRAGR